MPEAKSSQEQRAAASSQRARQAGSGRALASRLVFLSLRGGLGAPIGSVPGALRASVGQAGRQAATIPVGHLSLGRPGEQEQEEQEQGGTPLVRPRGATPRHGPGRDFPFKRAEHESARRGIETLI